MGAMHEAAASGDVAMVQRLAIEGQDIDEPCRDQDGRNDGATPLWVAAQNGATDVVAYLLGLGADANASTDDGVTALHTAAQHGAADVAKLLLEHGADIEATANESANAFLSISESDPWDVASPGYAHVVHDYTGATPLYLAARSGHASVVSLLLAHGARHATKTRNGVTPLAIAIEDGHDAVARLLAEHVRGLKAPRIRRTRLWALICTAVAAMAVGATIWATSGIVPGWKVIWMLLSTQLWAVFGVLFALCLRFEAKMEEAGLNQGEGFGSVLAVIVMVFAFILTLGAVAAEPGPLEPEDRIMAWVVSGLSLLLVAGAWLVHGAGMRTLGGVPAGPPREPAPTSDVPRPVSFAFGPRVEQMLGGFLDDASLWSTSGYAAGLSRLCEQALSCSMMFAHYVPEQPLGPLSQEQCEEWALRWGEAFRRRRGAAIEECCPEPRWVFNREEANVALLLRWPPVGTSHYAELFFHVLAKDIEAAFLDCGGRCGDGDPVMAVSVRECEAAQVLGQVAEHLQAVYEPAPALHRAVQLRDAVEVARLIEAGADVNAVDPTLGGTPLHWVAVEGDVRTAEILIAHGADVNAREHDVNGWTALHWASAKGHLEMARLLIRHGADPSMADAQGQTPLEVAYGNGQADIARLLRE